MTTLCTELPDYRPLSSILPDHDRFSRSDDAMDVEIEVPRPDFEANVSRAFQALALRWLDDLFEAYPRVTASCGRNRITIAPLSPQGFAATLSTENGRCNVHLGPIREEFGSVAEATRYMTAAIRGDLRLRLELARRPHRWAVEHRLPGNAWLDDASGEVSLETPPGNFWYFCNDPDPD